ncbi:MAG: Na(+)/H(+) antiporter subunit D, partial [Verrucomicrobiae bacterium]|nr:Na(+)/H(+) antiporter subunit D [Verrucomicrobiae bacterium]
LAFLCIYMGIRTTELYSILPYEVDYEAYTLPHFVTQMQLLMLSALVFFLFLPMLKRTATISLDTDWFYRKGGALFYNLMDKGLNGINAAAHKLFVGGGVKNVAKFAAEGPSHLLLLLMTPYWKAKGKNGQELTELKTQLKKSVDHGSFPIGITAWLSVLVIGLLFFF